jgi:hypothetical protein
MKMLYDEITRRFPELRDKFWDGDDELPYVVMGRLADWLKKLPEGAISPEIVSRLVSFAEWCEEQPEGKDAGDDLPTILTVGFYEKLFDSETTRALVPRFIAREQFVAGADYLRSWVGAENYEKAGKYYKPPV